MGLGGLEFGSTYALYGLGFRGTAGEIITVSSKPRPKRSLKALRTHKSGFRA